MAHRIYYCGYNGIYNNKESYVVDAVSNDLGIANIPLYLVGGSWDIDVHFKGDENYNPAVVNREININRFEQKETTIITENLQLNETELIAPQMRSIVLASTPASSRKLLAFALFSVPNMDTTSKSGSAIRKSLCFGMTAAFSGNCFQSCANPTGTKIHKISE